MAKVMTLYGRILSPYVTRVALAARAKGFKYEIKLPDGIKSPAYLKLNPLGKIPVLIDGKAVVYESPVIVDYLEAKSRAKRLLPSAAKAAAQVRLVGAVAAEYVQGPAVKLFRLKRGTATEPVDVTATLAAFNQGLDALEKIMPKGKFACGAKFSMADCYVAPAMIFAYAICEMYSLGDFLAARPKVKRYCAAIKKDKIAKPVLEDMEAMMRQAMAGQLPPMKQ